MASGQGVPLRVPGVAVGPLPLRFQAGAPPPRSAVPLMHVLGCPLPACLRGNDGSVTAMQGITRSRRRTSSKQRETTAITCVNRT